MNGSKTTSMTTDEMREARARGETLSDFERVRREAAAGIRTDRLRLFLLVSAERVGDAVRRLHDEFVESPRG